MIMHWNNKSQLNKLIFMETQLKNLITRFYDSGNKYSSVKRDFINGRFENPATIVQDKDRQQISEKSGQVGNKTRNIH
jgi:hypothetical protein